MKILGDMSACYGCGACFNICPVEEISMKFNGEGFLEPVIDENDNLYTVDVVCHGVPSPGLFQEHLKNSFGGAEKIEDVEFRSREGWASLFKVKSKSGEVETFYNHNSIYMQTFLQNVNLRASCFRCQYSRLPRQGDITIGALILWQDQYGGNR